MQLMPLMQLMRLLQTQSDLISRRLSLPAGSDVQRRVVWVWLLERVIRG